MSVVRIDAVDNDAVDNIYRQPISFNDWAEECLYAPLLNLAKNTMDTYRYKFEKYIRPWNFPLDMDRRTVQRFINTLDSPNDKKVLLVLSSLLTYAVNYDVLDRNVCTRIKTKRYIQPDRLWLPFKSLGHYGNTRNPIAYDEHIRFMATTGLRLGEAQALTQDDVQRAIDTGWLIVDKSIHGTTKSSKPRKVPYLGHGLIMSGIHKGQPITFPKGRQFTECFTRTHGRGYTLHSLRYTYAHLLKTKGIHPTVAQRLLGHSTITLTLGLYTGVMDEELEEARLALQA